MSFRATVTEDMRPTKLCQKFEGHTGWVRDVIHLPDGQQIMTCSEDGSLGVWNLQTGKHIANWRDGKIAVYSIALSVDGKKVVSGSFGEVRLWNMETGKVLAKWTGHTLNVSSVCWNRDGERVLSGSWDGTARVWDVETGNTILEINTGLDMVYTATFSPDSTSTLIATGGESSVGEQIKIWDANTGKLVTILKGHTWDVNCLAWTPDGRMLISGSSDDTIRTWNTSTWQQLSVLTGHPSYVYGVAISLNGRILASASWDKTARLWSLENGQPIGSPLRHPSLVNCVSLSTDGTLLATGCNDGNVYTWDVSAIIKEAGLNEFLDGEKSFLHVNATRRPIQQAKNVRTIPTNFFAEPPSHPDPAIIRPTSPPTEYVHDDAPPEEVQPSSPEERQHAFFAWLHSITPARSTFMQRARLYLFRRSQRHHDEGVELQEHPPSILNVPLAQGLLRHANEGGVRRMREKKKRDEDVDEAEDEDETDEKEKANQATTAIGSMNAMNAVPASQPSTRNNVAQPSVGPSRAKRSAEPHPTTFTSPADATTPVPNTSTPLLGAVTLRAGCCTCLLLCTGCVSRHRDGHH